MKLLLALYDRATEAYGAVMTVHTRGEGIRSFRDECNNVNSQLYKHPTDYELYQLAQYNEETGEIIQMHEMLARAEDHKERS